MLRAIFTGGLIFALVVEGYAQPMENQVGKITDGAYQINQPLVAAALRASSLGSNVQGQFVIPKVTEESIYDVIDPNWQNNPLPDTTKGEQSFNDIEKAAWQKGINVMKIRGVDPNLVTAIGQFNQEVKGTGIAKNGLSAQRIDYFLTKGIVAIPDQSVVDAFAVLNKDRTVPRLKDVPPSGLPNTPEAAKALETVAAYTDSNAKLMALREQVRDARTTEKFEKQPNRAVITGDGSWVVTDNEYNLPKGTKPKSPREAIATAFAAVKQYRTDKNANAEQSVLDNDLKALSAARTSLGYALGIDADRGLGDDEIIGLGFAQEYFIGRETGGGELAVGHLLNTPEIRQGADLMRSAGKVSLPLPVNFEDRTDITKEGYGRLDKNETSSWRSAHAATDPKARDKPGDPIVDRKKAENPGDKPGENPGDKPGENRGPIRKVQ